MENQEPQTFDEAAAFEEAASEMKSSGETQVNTTDDAENTDASLPDQQVQDADNIQPSDVPDWLKDASDEVKENVRKLEEERKRFEHMAKSQRGRVGALSKKYQQAKAALDKIKSNSSNIDADIERLKEDYPEMAEVLSRIVTGQNKRLDAISDPLSQLAEANVQDLVQQELDGNIALVSSAVPDAEQIVADQGFHQWVQSQPKGVQALFRSDDPNDAIYLLNEYKKVTFAKQDNRTKRTQQLSAMSLPNGRNSPKGGAEDLDENSLFNRIAEDMKRNR
ncbi:hypothetical protein QV08_01285 [Gallibacterium salpingitidis]|uniref:Scaffolding protein n=1 Tax=Gallibacterium salpingitidis TaxID=505341 RepID=A0AB36E2H9_9PAST|nr:hypothetical protein [Gallibacterium salpingitidis]OBX09598.1 hypothetical protein QV08_01285 [Gallibacterium salpingitidis]OBX10453.1 hypothetical protein QV09_05840 [Gallibacterium salpingitidis]